MMGIDPWNWPRETLLVIFMLVIKVGGGKSWIHVENRYFVTQMVEQRRICHE